MNKLQAYLLESVAEMKKVVWPTRKQTADYTILVIVLSVGMAVFFGILDYVFGLGLEGLIQ